MDWLKRIFGGAPRTNKIADIEAKLIAPDGSGLYGDAEYEAYDNGHWEFEAELEHKGREVAGPLDVKINGVSVGQLVAKHGESELKLRSGTDTMAEIPQLGSTIEIHGPTGLLVSGTFEPDR